MNKFLQKRNRLIFGIVAVSLLPSTGCHMSQDNAVPVSSLVVERSAGEIRIKTKEAQFILKPEGALSAKLKRDANLLELEGTSSPPSIIVLSNHREIADFARDLEHANVEPAAGKLGKLGKKIEVKGESQSSGLEERLTLEVYDDFPSMALLSAAYTNVNNEAVQLDSVRIQRHSLNASVSDSSSKPYEMWAFFGSSLKWGKDDVVQLPEHFSQDNPFGTPVATGDDLGSVGGGIPVVSFWTKSVGLAVGHLETLPLAVSIPVRTDQKGEIEVGVEIPADVELKKGQNFATPRTFVSVYSGDYYEPLNIWSRAVEREGLTRPKNNDENYAASWCGWGYESNVTPRQMADTIPKLKELGIHWATLDDRWFNNYGDWEPRSDTFPGRAIQQMVKEFHSQGMKLQLWWLPLAVEDGRFKYEDHKYGTADVVRQHPDWLVLNKDGQPARMARNLAVLCPAITAVREYYKNLTERFIRDWDFDGHKLDNIYTVPKCYNPNHHHKSPLDSVYAMGEVYKTIFETTRALKSDSVTQSCPCGTPPNLAWLRYMDQAVTADPVGSMQVRRRMKMYKAVLGANAAIYGDHVELTKITGADTGNEQDLGEDFASTMGTGGVLGTKFTWPDYGPKLKNVYLNRTKEEHWKKWIKLYNDKMLSKGIFRNLYVYGYDVPEAYAIEKDGAIYYAFYAPTGKNSSHALWNGEVELRGLGNRAYRVTDYVNGQDYGSVNGQNAKLNVNFIDSLLLEAK